MNDPIVLASTYRLTAVSFRVAAEAVAAKMELQSNGQPAKIIGVLPFYFLVSHATELFLKSALLKRGFAESDLKKYDYGHNLNALLQALQDKGVVITSETISLIDGLHQQHHSHALRYTALLDDGQPIFIPPVPVMFKMLDELLLLTRIATQGI